MFTPRFLLSTLAAAALMVAGLGIAAWSMLPVAEAHSYMAAGGHGGGWGQRHGHRGSHRDHCARLGEEHTRIAGLMISAHLDLDDGQKAELEPVLEVLEDWRSDAQALCFTDIANSDDALATAQAFMELSAGKMAALRPAWANFEAALDDSQRAHIQEMIDRHRDNG